MRALLVVLVAVNPPAVVAGRAGSAAIVAVAAAAALAVAIGLAGASSGLLDVLDVSAATFRLAAGVVLAAASLWEVLAGARSGPASVHADADARAGVDARAGAERRPTAEVVLWLAALVTPQLAAVSVSLGADDGVGTVALAATAVLAVTLGASLLGRSPVAWWAAGRVVGAFGVAVALGMVVDGVKTV